MKGEVDRAKISKIVAAIGISQRSKTVMEKASILANAFDSEVYLLSVVEMRHTNVYVSHTIAGKIFDIFKVPLRIKVFLTARFLRRLPKIFCRFGESD